MSAGRLFAGVDWDLADIAGIADLMGTVEAMCINLIVPRPELAVALYEQ